MMRSYVQKQLRVLESHLPEDGTLLDFGCGDLSLAAAIRDYRRPLTITGVDVVDSGAREPGIRFQVYEGRRLPFKNMTFGTTVVYHVLHHTDNPKAALTEVIRVTSRKVLLVEPVFRHGIDLFFMKLLDRINNGWRTAVIPMPFTFQKESTWVSWARDLGWKVSSVTPAGVFPEWLPVGTTKLFVLTRR